MLNKDKKIEIPVQGNLGILAHGDIAIEAWRKVRGAIKEQELKKDDKKKDENE
jgi:hypothetical protein